MGTEIEGHRYYSLQEVAELVNVSRQTLWRWRQEGSVPLGRSLRGRQLLFSEFDLDLIQKKSVEISAPNQKVHNGIYLDNAATTQPHTVVIHAMEKAMSDHFGNASSAHERGVVMRRALSEARQSVAALCNCDIESVYFTSGCTEANNWVIQQRKHNGEFLWKKIVSTRIEHSSVLGAVQSMEAMGCPVDWANVSTHGRIVAKDIEKCEIDKNTLVAIQWANNETGIVHEITEIAELVKERGGHFLCDAAQAFGKVPLNFCKLPIDYLTVSSHKIHGPQGVGALIAKKEAPVYPMLFGGGQESGKRPGTENSVGIIGFGTAAAVRNSRFGSSNEHCRSLRANFENELKSYYSNFSIAGEGLPRLCSISNVRIHGVEGQALVARLGREGIFVSQSSACTNMRPEPSYVLREMGLSEEKAYEAIRVSIGEDNSMKEITRLIRCMKKIISKFDSVRDVKTNQEAR